MMTGTTTAFSELAARQLLVQALALLLALLLVCPASPAQTLCAVPPGPPLPFAGLTLRLACSHSLHCCACRGCCTPCLLAHRLQLLVTLSPPHHQLGCQAKAGQWQQGQQAQGRLPGGGRGFA